MSRDCLQTVEEASLIRIKPARNAFRFYRATLWPNLFGGVSLVREWGRIGQAGRLRITPYADAAAARQAMDRLVARKQRRGYRKAA